MTTNQANAKNRKTERHSKAPSRDVNKFPIVSFSLEIHSTLLKEYLTKNTGLYIANYGRIGGLLRMASSDKNVSVMIKDWFETNLNIGYSQVEEISSNVDAAELISEEDNVTAIVKHPDPLALEWNVNHPIFRRLISLIKKADDQITKAEKFYYTDLIDDNQYRMLQAIIVNMLSGLLDRVVKATSPGKRGKDKDARYFPAELMQHIRTGGYRLEFFDLPSDYREMADIYNAKYALMKSLIEERAKKAASAKTKDSDTPTVPIAVVETSKEKPKATKRKNPPVKPKANVEEDVDASHPTKEEEPLDLIDVETHSTVDVEEEGHAKAE
jgi:hypothetical protein